MTKLLDVRVRVPVDDAVTVGDLTSHLQKHLEALPVQRIVSDLTGPDDGPRVHWSAVDVLRHAERADIKPVIEKPGRARRASMETT